MIVKTEKYTASVTIGLQKVYSEELWNKKDVISLLQKIQNKLIEKEQVYLSASVTECDIVLSGQCEPSLKIEFINYPRFPLEEEEFKSYVMFLTKQLMDGLVQNRVVVVYHNEIVMLENNEDVDPRVI